MNLKIASLFGIFLLLYGLCNYYIGLRVYQAFNTFYTSNRPAIYGAGAVTMLALSFPLSRLIIHYLPQNLGKIIIYASSYWLAAMYYLILILIISDLTRLIVHRSEILPASLKGHYHIVILSVLALVALLLVYGTWNALHPVVRNYEVTLHKKSSTLDSMRVVVVSDIHLGWIVGIDRLQQMTVLINSLQPDLILLPGDIIDEGVDLATEREMPEVLQTLQPRLGTFAAMGNHEYISGNAETTIDFLKRAGITVLRDQAVEITNGFYLIGRDDAARHRFYGAERLELSEIMADLDKNKLPIILLDHEPSNLDISETAGVELQLSGHTHRGQMFPNNYITAAIFEQDWGYLRKNSLQVIVSCGFGTWGPPIRIGNRPEILNIEVIFADSPQ